MSDSIAQWIPSGAGGVASASAFIGNAPWQAATAIAVVGMMISAVLGLVKERDRHTQLMKAIKGKSAAKTLRALRGPAEVEPYRSGPGSGSRRHS